MLKHAAGRFALSDFIHFIAGGFITTNGFDFRRLQRFLGLRVASDTLKHEATTNPAYQAVAAAAKQPPMSYG